MKKKMDIWEDAWALGQRAGWQTVAPPKPEPKKVPENRPEALVRRESQRQKTLAKLKAQEPPPDPAKVSQRTELCAIDGFNPGPNDSSRAILAHRHGLVVPVSDVQACRCAKRNLLSERFCRSTLNVTPPRAAPVIEG